MTQENSTTPDPDQQPTPKRKRRRWPWVILIIFLILIALIALAPTIAGTAPVRSFIVGKINQNINGSAEIGDLSLSWFSPTSITGVKVYDANKRLILDIPKIKLGISVLGAIRQNFALGDDNQIDVASFVLHVDDDGKTNLQQLVKTEPSAPKSKEKSENEKVSQPTKIPNVSGKFAVNFQGTVESSGPAVNVRASSATLAIDDINKPIAESVKLVYQIGDGENSTVQADGTIGAIQNNIVDIDKLTADQKLVLNKVDFAVADPFLKSLGPDTKLAGLADGSVDIKAQGITGISASGQINVNNLLFAGGPLAPGDKIQTNLIVPISITRTVIDSSTTKIKIDKLNLQTPQATVAVSGEVTQESLTNIANHQAPGSEGNLAVNIDVTGLADLLSQIGHTLKVQQDVKITGGSAHEELAMAIHKDDFVVSQKLNASIEGTRANGQPIKPQPISFNAQTTVTPNGKPVPVLRDIQIAWSSSFATIDGGGSLAKLSINSKFDLSKLRTELAQFVDLGNLQMQGNGDFNFTTNGDVSDQNAPITASANLNLQNVKVSGVASQEATQENLALLAKADLIRSNNSVTRIDNANLTIISGDSSAPLIDIAATGKADLAAKTGSFDLSKCTISDLKKLQDQYGGFIPALATQKIQIDSGAFYASAAGTFDDKTLKFTKPAGFSLGGFAVSRDGRKILNREVIRASVDGSCSATSVELTEFSIAAESKLFNISKSGDAPLKISLAKSIQGSGAIAYSADLKRLSDIAQAFGGQIATADQPQLRSGQLQGTIDLAKAEKTTIKLDSQINGLTVFANGANALDNQQVTMSLQADADDSANAITASGKINSAFAQATLSNVKISPAAGMWDQLSSANVDATADVAKLYTLANSVMPATATTQPIVKTSRKTKSAAVVTDQQAPLQVTSGSASLKLALSRDTSQKITTINVSDCRITNLAIARDKQIYRFDPSAPITATFAAAIKADQKIDSVSITDLSADLGVAKISMPDKIVAANLQSTPDIQGSVKIEGSLNGARGLAPLLNVVQGSAFPYAGDFVAVQKVTKQANGFSLDGTASATKFQVIQNSKPVFSEDKVDIVDKVDVDPNTKTATVQSFTLNMAQSQALGVKFTGQIIDWENVRTIKGVNSDKAQLDLTYDLEKLWPIIEPMLSPEMQQQYKDLKIRGKYAETFTIWGAYPQSDQTNVSMAMLNANGTLALDFLDLPQGLTVENFVLPFSMTKGLVKTAAAPAADNRKLQSAIPTTSPIIATTALCNGGALNLDNIGLDMRSADPLLSIGRKHWLLRDVKLNPVLADTLGHGNLLFKDANEASGDLDVQIVECKNVPLGDLLKKSPTAQAQIVFNVDNLQLDGPVPQVMGQVLNLGGNGIRGNIKNGTLSLNNGMAQTDFAVLLAQTQQVKSKNAGDNPRTVETNLPLSFKGGVVLASGALKDFFVNIPSELINDRIGGKNIRQALPAGIAVPITGTTDHFKIDIAGAVAKSVGNSILKGGGGDQDVLQNLGNLLDNNKKKSKKSDQ
jgi:hypothetical protein